MHVIYSAMQGVSPGQSGAAPGAGGDAEGAEAVGEPGGGDRPSGEQAGEQPFPFGGCADAGVGLAVGDEGEQQVAERGGDGNVVLAELYGDAVVVAGDLAGGERGDAGHGLSVEQDQAPGGPVGDLDAVVMQQPGCQVPALGAGDRGSGVPLRAGDIEGRAVPAAGGPGEEFADVTCSGAGGQPVLG